MKLLYTLFICAFTGICHAQDKSWAMSAPVDIKETGVNKVLCMKNGNTMLFHFEPGKPIVVKVFDSTHKEIAGQKHSCRYLDVTMIKDAVFKGLFPIKEEAVMFFDQEHLSKRRLIRLRFNGVDGKLTEEKVVDEWPSMSKRTDYYIMKDKEDDNYQVLYCTDIPQFLDCNVHVAYFNNNHEMLKDVPFTIDRKRYDELSVVGAQSKSNGVCVTLCLLKLKHNATSSAGAPRDAVYDHHFAIMYIPRDSSKVVYKVMDVSTEVFPYYSNYSYNPFAKSVNVLLYSYKTFLYRNGITFGRGSINSHLFLKLNDDNSDLGFKWMNYEMANEYVKKSTDTNHYYEGMPLSMFTNDNGLTTVISEGHNRYGEPATSRRYDYGTYLGDIGITQFDDDGNEIWATVLPNSQVLNSMQHFYAPRTFRYRRESYYIFNDLPEAVYDRQFVSINSYQKDRNFYIIYNDYDKNFNNSIAKPGDTVYNFTTTNACYYKMDRRKEITKHYLFGGAVAGEYKSSFIEGADFDEQRGMYVTLVQCKKEDHVTLCMGWSRLD